MRQRCVAANCRNCATDKIHLYRFPKDEKLKGEWTAQLKRTRADWQGPTESSRICSEHFTEDCFNKMVDLRQSLGFGCKSIRNILPHAVPTLFNRKGDPKPLPEKSEAIEKLRRKQIIEELLCSASHSSTNAGEDTKVADKMVTIRCMLFKCHAAFVDSLGHYLVLTTAQDRLQTPFSTAGEIENEQQSSCISTANVKLKNCNENKVKVKSQHNHNRGKGRKIKPTYTCDDCGVVFNGKQYLHAHIKSHIKEKSCICTICGESVYNKEVLGICTKTHDTGKSVISNIFGKGILTDNATRLSGRTPNSENDLLCKECGNVYRESDLLIHMKISKCMECGHEFRCSKYLQDHIRFHHTKIDISKHILKKTYTCGFCGKKFHTMNRINAHLTSSHPFENYVCGICYKRYPDEFELESVEMQMESIVAEGIKCEVTVEESKELCPAKSSVSVLDTLETFSFVEVNLPGHHIFDKEGECNSNIKEEMEENDIKVDPDFLDTKMDLNN